MKELTTKQKEEYAAKYGRWIEDNEIVIEDLPEAELMLVMDKVGDDGYNVEYWKSDGQKSGHLHIKDIQGLDNLNKEELSKYKEFFIKKYVLKIFYEEVDFQLCGKHRIVEENKIHYKYNKPKLLIKEINKGVVNLADKEILEQCKQEIIIKTKRKLDVSGSGFISKIVSNLSIISLARQYGFKVKGNKAICRFHNDKNPSLFFDDSRGFFKCFGCEKSGNIVDFIVLCKQYKFEKIKNVPTKEKM